MTGKAWSPDEAKLVAKITANNLRDMHTVLEDADKRGDAAVAVKLLDPVTELLRVWGRSKEQPGDRSIP